MTHGPLLDSVVAQALAIGSRPSLVQGAGGNLSVKIDDVVWIKASGTRLRDAATQQIFVSLDRNKAATAVLEREDLADLVLDSGPTGTLRPSIETAIHTLLPHTFVSHVHAVGAIAVGVDDSADTLAEELADLARTIVVPYAKPGIQLARAILSALRESGAPAPGEPLIMVLGNHGLIVAAPSSEQILEIITAVEVRWAAQPLDRVEDETSGDWRRIANSGALEEHAQDLLLGGALTPDQGVFLGFTPFTRLETPGADSLAAVDISGGVWVRSSISIDAEEIARSFVEIARSFRKGSQPRYLDAVQVDELLNWDAEKWRKAQES